MPVGRAYVNRAEIGSASGRLDEIAAYFTIIVESSTISCPTIQSGGTRAWKRNPQSTRTAALENFRSMVHCAQL
jgi:hypothetical protein